MSKTNDELTFKIKEFIQKMEKDQKWDCYIISNDPFNQSKRPTIEFQIDQELEFVAKKCHDKDVSAIQTDFNNIFLLSPSISNDFNNSKEQDPFACFK